MLNLNLLPPSEKTNLTHEIYRRIVSFVGLWFVVIGIAFGTLLLPSYFLFYFQASEADRARAIEDLLAKAAGIVKIEERVRDINLRLGVVIDRAKKKHDASVFINEILAKSPSSVSITTIVTKNSLDDAAISGKAATRDSLLKFIGVLEESPLIKSVSSPTANIIKETDILFSLEVKTIYASQ